jgi:hypothetical protein
MTSASGVLASVMSSGVTSKFSPGMKYERRQPVDPCETALRLHDLERSLCGVRSTEWAESRRKLANFQDSTKSANPVYSGAIEEFIGWLPNPKYGFCKVTGVKASWMST